MSEANNYQEETEGVSTILGDPKKAILKLSGPMIIAMFVTSLYSLIDSVWVAGLGQDALAAVGFISPVFLVVMGFANGLGAGATSVISRYIGAKNKKGADNTALHIMLLVVIFTAIVMITIGAFLEPILQLLGASAGGGNTLELGLIYGSIIFGGAIFLIFSSASYGILRAEGNVKKTTYAMIISAVINMILDPILIYVFGWGIAGAAISTIISMAIVCILILYWFKTETYIKFRKKDFNFSKKILKKILGVGLPAGVEFLVIAILAGALNLILVMVSGTDAVAIYSAGWRVVMIAIVPIISVSLSVVAIIGAAFGARKYENFTIVQNYSIKLGTLIAIITAVATYILAPVISGIFTYSGETAHLSPFITDFLRVMCLFYIFVPIGSVAASIFQGVGRGFDSLMLTTIRELFLAVVFAYILAIPMGLGQEGVWWGIVVGNILGGLIAYIWSKIYINKLIAIKGRSREHK